MTSRTRRAAAGWTAVTLIVLSAGCGGSGDAPAAPPLTLLAPAAPGGGWDQTARVMQDVLRSTELAPTAQVINVPGAGGVIGLAQVANAHQGDGRLMMMTGLIMMGAILTNDAVVTLDDVTPMARLLGEYEVLVVPADSPVATLDDFVAEWRRDPGGLAIAGGSAGGTDHILVGLLAQAVGVDTTRINYLPHSGGGESMASLLGGHVAAGVNGFAELQPFIEAGRLRPLGISSEERVEGLEIPTFREQGWDVTLANWRGVAAPPGLSDEQRSELLALLDGMHASQEWRQALEQNTWTDLYLTGPEYERFLQRESEHVESVLRSIGLID